MPLAAGQTILNKYTLRAHLGQGAFAHVWLADDLLAGRQVAIKELRRADLSQQEFQELTQRFRLPRRYQRV